MAMQLVVAVSKNGVIGDSKKPGMLWHVPEELKHFKRVTMGTTLVMGRVTAELVGKLPGRDAIVISRDPGYKLDGFKTMLLGDFLIYDGVSGKEFSICGGGEIYKLLTEKCDRAAVSTMNLHADGDVLFGGMGDNFSKMLTIKKIDYEVTYYANKHTCHDWKNGY